MKIVRLLCLLLLAVSLGAVGCGSSDGDSASSSTGTGAVVTAFVKSGTVVVKSIEGEQLGTGTVTNSKLHFDIATDIARPFIVEVDEATLSSGQPLRSPLSRVVEDGDSLDELFITAFSTIKAQAYAQAYRAGQDAGATSDAVLMGVFNSLGLNMGISNAEALGKINPLNSPELEVAQQSLFTVMGVDDIDGLVGLSDKIQTNVLLPMISDDYLFTAATFIKKIAPNPADKTPAQLVADARDDINEFVRKTFEEGQALGATSVSATEALEEAATVKQIDLDAPAVLAVTNSYVGYVSPQSETSTHKWNLVVKNLKNEVVTGSFTFNATTTEDILCGTIDGEFSSSVIDSPVSDGLFVKRSVPGHHRIIVESNGATLELLNIIMKPDTVFLISMEPELDPSPAYIGFEASPGSTQNVKTYVPAGSTGTVAAVGEKDSPALAFQLGVWGSGSNFFDVYYSTPPGLAIVEDGVEKTEGKIELEYSNSTWKLTGDSESEFSLEMSLHDNSRCKVSFRNDIQLKATSDLDFGEKTFAFKGTEANSEKILISRILPVYVLNKAGKDLIGEIGPVTWAGTVPSQGDQAYVDVLLDSHPLEATVKSWEQVVNVSSPVAPKNPDAGAFYHLGSTDGGFFEGTDTPDHNIEIAPVIDVSSDFSKTLTDVKLRILVGEGKDNYENIDLRFRYIDPDGTGKDYEQSSIKSLKLESGAL